jgi:glycosyltransferase involved in cell wall biosynthesis
LHYVIALMKADKYGYMLEDAGVNVQYLDMPRGKLTFKGLIRLWGYLRKIRPDVVQTWMYHSDLIGGVIARLAGMRRIFWGIRNSNLGTQVLPRSTILVARICALLSPFVPTAIVSCSQQAALAHQTFGYASKKFVIIPNGYPINQFKPDNTTRNRLRAEWDIDPETVLLGMVARFDPQKDHDNLLKALRIVKTRGIVFRCALIGSGMTADNRVLMDVISAQHLMTDILLLGRQDDIPAVMNALDLHVLSSCGEAFPNVLAEAMACGVPCVTTNVGDSKFIVGETGWVVKAKDPEVLADAIEAALIEMKDKQQWHMLAELARKRIIDHFSLETMVSAYRDLWSQSF